MKRDFTIKTFVLIAFLIVFLLLPSCSKKSSMDATGKAESKQESSSIKNSKSEAPSTADSAKPAEQLKNDANNSVSTPSLPQTERKIITTSSIEMETLSFDKAISTLLEQTKAIGGYIESSNISGRRIEEEGNLENRSAKFILRIPKQIFDTFATDIGKLGNVLSKTSSGQDVTGQYFDTEAHLKSLKIQEERLLELLKKSGELKDIIELEKETANVRYQIENLTGTLKKWDNLVDYSTLTIHINEVQEIKTSKKAPISIADKMILAFKDSLLSLLSIGKGLLIFIAVLLPYIFSFFLFYLLLRYVFKFKNLNTKIKNLFKGKMPK